MIDCLIESELFQQQHIQKQTLAARHKRWQMESWHEHMQGLFENMQTSDNVLAPNSFATNHIKHCNNYCNVLLLAFLTTHTWLTMANAQSPSVSDVCCSSTSHILLGYKMSIKPRLVNCSSAAS